MTTRMPINRGNRDAAIRPIRRDDLPALKNVIDATELFPSELLDEMTSTYFTANAGSSGNAEKANTDFWLTWDNKGAKALAYCAPEKLTSGTWNLYLIAVHPDFQGLGYGTALMQYVEQFLASQEERILLVETSGLPGFARTRAFYLKCGYEEEARIRDFYESGDDKIIFRKRLKSNF